MYGNVRKSFSNKMWKVEVKCTRACDDNLISILFQDRNFFLQSRRHVDVEKVGNWLRYIVFLFSHFQFSACTSIRKSIKLVFANWNHVYGRNRLHPELWFHIVSVQIKHRLAQSGAIFRLPPQIMSVEKFSVLIFRLLPSGER